MFTALTNENVKRIYKDSIIKPRTESWVSVTRAKGFRMEAFFHPKRLESHRKEIIEMLQQLHPRLVGEVGTSFLNAFYDSDGDSWTRDPTVVDKLLVLGVGIDAVKFPAQESHWYALEYGMPTVALIAD